MSLVPRAMYSVSLASLALWAAIACGPDKEAETAGYQQGQAQYGQTGGFGGQAAAPAGYAGQGYGAPQGYGQTGVPAASSGLGGAPVATVPVAGGSSVGGANAHPIDPGSSSVVQPLLNELAKTHMLPGSKPLGAPLAGAFQTGQKLEVQVQLQPQKCYTVVATALPPVTDLNVQIQLATPIPNLSPVLATDSESGPTGVIGKKPNCYKWPFPLPGPIKLVLQVVGGTGLAAAQIYEK